MVRRIARGHAVDLSLSGEGRPVLTLHGFPLDRRSLARSLEPLFERRLGYRRIHLDLPGFGTSPGALEIDSSDAMVEFVIAFIDEVVGDEPLLIVGESWGAYLARGVVARRPGQVAGVALLCPVVIATQADRELPRRERLHESPRLFDDADPAEVAAFWEVAVIADRGSWDHWQSAIQPAIAAADPAATARIETRYAFELDVDSVGEPFNGPSLIVVGRQDSVVGYRDALRLVDRYPRSTFAVIDAAGHNVAGERPKLLEALVDDWLDRVERG